jgi:hypothetical protein
MIHSDLVFLRATLVSMCCSVHSSTNCQVLGIRTIATLYPLRLEVCVSFPDVSCAMDKKEGTSESANHPVHETRLEIGRICGCTLAMIGGCNFLLGWPILVLAHFLDR